MNSWCARGQATCEQVAAALHRSDRRRCSFVGRWVRAQGMAVDDIRSVGVEARIEGIEGFPRSCARVCARPCARAIGSVDKRCGEIPRVPTGEGGGAGDPSSGLNDNPRYSIPLKRSFALVCMYYDHLQLSLPPPSPPRYVVRSDRIDTSSSRSWSWNETFVYGIRKS